jgi:hypothetical protein
MRRMSADDPDHDRSVWIRGLSACLRLLLYAERDYKTVRLEYVKRLLDTALIG